jgi:hypothetical protein
MLAPACKSVIQHFVLFLFFVVLHSRLPALPIVLAYGVAVSKDTPTQEACLYFLVIIKLVSGCSKIRHGAGLEEHRDRDERLRAGGVGGRWGREGGREGVTEEDCSCRKVVVVVVSDNRLPPVSPLLCAGRTRR